MLTPLAIALLIGSFWAGIGTAAVVSHNGGFDHHRSDVVITAQPSDHSTACHARYRSYQDSSDMWLGNDGAWHPCTL
jgi:hypothetical protein